MAANPMDVVSLETQPGSLDGITVMKVTGALTIKNFFDFQDKTRNNTEPILVVDLGGVPYMDSAALGALLGLHVSCEKHNRKYALINVNQRLDKLFQVCGVREVLTTYPTLGEAETALKK